MFQLIVRLSESNSKITRNNNPRELFRIMKRQRHEPVILQLKNKKYQRHRNVVGQLWKHNTFQLNHVQVKAAKHTTVPKTDAGEGVIWQQMARNQPEKGTQGIQWPFAVMLNWPKVGTGRMQPIPAQFSPLNKATHPFKFVWKDLWCRVGREVPMNLQKMKKDKKRGSELLKIKRKVAMMGLLFCFQTLLLGTQMSWHHCIRRSGWQRIPSEMQSCRISSTTLTLAKPFDSNHMAVSYCMLFCTNMSHETTSIVSNSEGPILFQIRRSSSILELRRQRRYDRKQCNEGDDFRYRRTCYSDDVGQCHTSLSWFWC